MSESAASKTAELKIELDAMKKIEKILAELSPGVMRRVGTWVANYSGELADQKESSKTVAA